jgi:hypothetical protein
LEEFEDERKDLSADNFSLRSGPRERASSHGNPFKSAKKQAAKNTGVFEFDMDEVKIRAIQ